MEVEEKEMTTQEWIKTRYGPISFHEQKIVVASVPVMGGVATGVGATEAEALEALRKDLSGGGRS